MSLGRAIGEFTRISAAYRYEVLEISELSENASQLLQQSQGESTTSSITPKRRAGFPGQRVQPDGGLRQFV